MYSGEDFYAFIYLCIFCSSHGRYVLLLSQPEEKFLMTVIAMHKIACIKKSAVMHAV